MAGRPTAKRKIPIGVHILALLLFLVGGVWLLAALVLTLLGTNVAPWYVELAAAAYFMTIGWGLWGGRRWAYFAALLMCLVLGFYAFRTAIVFQQNMLAPLLVLLAIVAYLMRRTVRAAFLNRSGE
jgi:uncharacterized membrane protein (DUF2068 family)